MPDTRGCEDDLTLELADELPRSRKSELTLLLVPLIFALTGLAVRYFAYSQTVADASLASFASDLCRWDCIWYVRLSEEGYDPFPVPAMTNAANWAFFPLYPMLIAILRTALGLPTMVVATATSIALSMLAARVCWPLLGKNLRAYVLFSAFLLAGPFSVYFTTFYTEVLFLLLTACTFAMLARGRYLAAGGFAALVSATRIVGVFLVLAMVLQAFLDYRRRGGKLLGFVADTIKRPDLMLAIFIAPLGLFAYMAFLHWHIGDALAFSHVQRAWGRVTASPLFYLWQGLNTYPVDSWVPTASQQLAVASLVGLGLTGMMFVQRRFAEGLFCLICLLLPLAAGLASMLRFVVGLAPVVLMASRLCARYAWLYYPTLVVLLIGGYFGTVGWLTRALSLV